MDFQFNVFTPHTVIGRNPKTLKYSRLDNLPQTESCTGRSDCNGGPECSPEFRTNPCIDTDLIMRINASYECKDTDGYCAAEDVHSGNCTCWSYAKNCTQKKIAVCAKFDQAGTCLLGTKGTSDENVIYTQNVNWGINSTNNPYDGWAICHYEWNFNNYTSTSNEPQKFTQWLNDIYDNTGNFA